MRYQQLGTGASYPYPDNNIDPAKKGKDFCMQYARAAYYDWSYSYPKGVFANNNGDYEKFRMYALAKQPITPYKKMLGVEEMTNNTWMSVDWSIRSIVSPYRDKAISRLMEQELDVVATPIDITAKAELDDYYSNIKAKLAVRKLIQDVNQEMANHPMISLQPGEPMDIEELEMRVELGEQFNRSKDAELAIQLGFYENDYTQFRRSLYEDLFDYGVGGYKEWLGSDNKAKFRKVNPENIVTNFCRQANFKDLIHAGELIDVSLIDLAAVCNEDGSKAFTNEELQEFAGSIAGRWGNPMSLGTGSGWFKPYDKFKCKVLDIEFYTYNDYNYRNAVDGNGNVDFRKADYGRGKTSDKYIRKRFKCVYKCKWIVGTEKCYDFGMATDQKRPQNLKQKWNTDLSFKFYAYNFYEMKAQGFMERLIPYLDDYQLTMLKIQNFKNRAVPSGWWIDLDALENVALNKGGKNMEPKELLKMFFETGVLVGRSKDAVGNPQAPNWKPVIPIENTAASELAMFYQDLVMSIQSIERITGYNEATMGEPNEKTLVPGYELANMSTQHSLYPMKFAEKYLTEKLAEDVLLRMQQGIKKGEITGFAPYGSALNQNVLRFIKLSPSIALREYGIMLEEKTTREERMWLLQNINQDIANQLLDTSDAVLIINTHNVKQAMMILSYKVKKAKEALSRQKMAEIEATNQGNQQAAMIAEQGKQQAIMLQYQFELAKQRMTIQGEIAKKQLEVESQERIAMQKNQTTLVEQNMENQGKVEVAEITAEAKAVSTVIAGEHAKEKQEIANKKPQSKSTK